MDKTESAFPVTAGGSVQHGMTLRDYFAAAALPSCINEAHADRAWEHGDTWQMYTAIQAYRWADAMLAARDAKALAGEGGE